MLFAFGWAALAVLGTDLALFCWGGVQAVRAATGLRVAFALVFAGPLLWLILPVLHKADPLWTEGRLPLLGLLGVAVATTGAVVAFGAQMSMEASRRVGIAAGEPGTPHPARNQMYLVQLLLGVALAIPALPTVLGAALCLWSATLRIRLEKAVRAATKGAAYDCHLRVGPRWIGWSRGQAA